MRSLECFLVFISFIAVQLWEINTKITISWAHLTVRHAGTYIILYLYTKTLTRLCSHKKNTPYVTHMVSYGGSIVSIFEEIDPVTMGERCVNSWPAYSKLMLQIYIMDTNCLNIKHVPHFG